MSKLSAAIDLPADDYVLPFHVVGMNVRAELVRLGPLVNQVLDRHDYPQPVSALLAEALALAALLGKSLKFSGIFTLQIKGDGPVSMLVADLEVGAEGQPGRARGYARYDGQALSYLGAAPSARALLGRGYLALTVDPGGDMERYQGIVELEGKTLAECAESYFRTSEQLPTRLHLAAGQVFTPESGKFGWRAGGLMIQYLPQGPVSGDDEAEQWSHASVLFGTIKAQELLDPKLGGDEMAYRLFHENGVLVFEPRPVQFGCRCSREKLDGVLRQFGKDDLTEMAIDGVITADCEFCRENYRFDLADLVGGKA